MSCHPCGPCRPSGPCRPCGPCGAAPVVELTEVEAIAAYTCIKAELAVGYAKSGVQFASQYQKAERYNRVPYQSLTHGNRYVNNYATSDDYGKFEDGGTLPQGTEIGKDSFTVSATGLITGGPLFLMEKMSAGFSDDTGDWRYTLITPGGKITGTTLGGGAAAVQFCADCHLGAEDQDYLFFLPEAFRK